MNHFLSSDDIDRVHRELMERYIGLGQRSYKERIKDLKALEKSILKHRAAIKTALHEDFRKPPMESDLSEIYVTLAELRHAKKHLRDWTAENSVPNPLSMFGMKAFLRAESKGVVLIIAPWNYPIALTLGPLISAIAAGNAVVLKPSEIAPKSAEVIASIVREAFPPEQVVTVCGGVETSQHLLSKNWHHIFFTGSPEIGKLVMQSAVETLTPITLELGGKSPAVIDESADIKAAANRIIWGKGMNAGQTCISPDYVLVHESKKDALLEAMKSVLQEFYKGAALPDDHASIVSEKHYLRQCELLEDATKKGAQIIAGGNKNDSKHYLSTTLLTNVNLEMRVMKEEIFGPILPILTYTDWDECLGIINQFERPLSLYHFSTSQKNMRFLIESTRAGSTCINQSLVQFNHPELPFGGINWSGMGKAHGKSGFDLFSNQRSFIKQKSKFNALRLITPPYTPLKQKLSDFMIRFF